MSVSATRVDELLEREVELAAISDLVRRAGEGEDGVVLVEGAAGIGKTVLLDAVAELASDASLRVLRARGGELERTFPFGVAGQLFARGIASLSAEQRSSVLAGAAELALPVVDPRAASSSPAMPSQEALYARLHGLYWLCAGLAALEPLMLLVDDAHWSDEPSLQWMLFLARRLAGVPVTLVPTSTFAARIRSLAPEGIVRSIIVRLGRMSRAAGALARAVAVLGTRAELRHAAALAALDLETASAAADALAAAGLLDPTRPLRLAHPVVRSAIYAELPAGERARLHRHAAELLEREHGNVDAAAAHLLASEPAGERRAVELLLAAAERALSRGSPRTAATYLERALAEPPPAEELALVLRRLGMIETFQGNERASEYVREATALICDFRERAELALELSYCYVVAGRFDDAVTTLERAIEEVAEQDQDLRWRLAAQAVSWARVDPAHAEVPSRYLSGVSRDLAGHTPGERAILAQLAVHALQKPEPVGVVADLAIRALADGQLIDEQPPGSLVVNDGIWVLVQCERHDLAMEMYDGMIEDARREGLPIAFALISHARSKLHRLRGAIPDAIADARAALDAGRDFGPSLIAPLLYGTVIALLLEVGDVEGAEEALASSGVGEQQLPQMLPLFTLLHGRGSLRLARGDAEGGLDDLLAAYRLLARPPVTPAGTYHRSAAAVALAAAGRREEARALVAAELDIARRFGAPSTLGMALRAAGVVEGGRAGIEYLREAVVQLEQSPARLEHARALADLGGALRRDGKRREAQETLRQALDHADRCGGRALADQVRAELVITGARPRRPRLSGVDALTASELRVAHMAAQGLPNPQIAQALFVSRATVVTHLSRCYQKLDINSRQQLAAALATSSDDAV